MPSLRSLCSKVRITVTYGASLAYAKQDDWQRKSNGYRVRLTFQRRSMSLDFWQGSAVTSDPTAEGVLECLLSDASGADESFEDWCAELGYDSDSRKAEAIYKAVKRQTEKLRRFLGAEFESFLYAER